MHEADVHDETWQFSCGHCGHEWVAVYEAHHTEAVDGDDVRGWIRNGLPSMGPAAGLPCPSCDEGLRVSALRARPRPARPRSPRAAAYARLGGTRT